MNTKQAVFHTSRAKFHYIYVTRCLITDRYYIGMHSTDNLDDDYIGSGKRLWQSIKKHGREQHICEILEFLSTREELRLREAEHVNEERLKLDPYCMNLALGGEGGWERCNKRLSPEQRSIIGKLGGQTTKEHVANDLALRLRFEEMGRSTLVKLRQERGTLKIGCSTDEQRLEMTKRAALPEAIAKRKKTFVKIGHQQGKKNSMYGHKHSPETIAKMKLAARRI